MISTSNIAQFLGLFIPSIIVIGGSYWIYQKRRRDERRYLRKALKAEVVQMQQMGHLPFQWNRNGSLPPDDKIPRSQIPPPEMISTDVYKNNSSKIGNLHDAEAVRLVEFYGMVNYIQALMEELRSDEEQSIERHEELLQIIIKYESIRQDISQMLDGRKAPYEVEIGFGRIGIEHQDLELKDMVPDDPFDSRDDFDVPEYERE